MPAHSLPAVSMQAPRLAARFAGTLFASAFAAATLAPAALTTAALSTATLATATIATTGIAQAGDWKKDKWGERREHRHRDRPIYGDGPLPDYIPGVGTYSGGVSAVRIPRHGTYFYVQGNRKNRAPSVLEAPNGGPKVVVPDKKAFEAACDRSRGGVCVIRP